MRSRGDVSAGVATVGVALYLIFFNQLADETFGHGPVNFARLVALACVTLGTPHVARRVAGDEATANSSSRVLVALLALVSAMIVVALLGATASMVSRPDIRHVAEDIAHNTYCAGTRLLARDNPWATRCQLGHDLASAEHVTAGAHGEVYLFGLRYRYGFPYFPAMALAYVPFRALGDGLHSIRIGNVVYFLATAAGVALLARQLAAPGRRAFASGLALVAFLGVRALKVELLDLAVTDFFIGSCAVTAYAALASGRTRTGAVLLGVAQAAKLLPGPLLALPALAYLQGRRARMSFVAMNAITAAAIVAPAVAASPEDFASSTLAFYLANHAAGDDTSLYFFLPPALKLPFNLLGGALSIAIATRGFWRRAPDWTSPVTDAFLSYVALTAFNRMTHLNYLWSVHCLGAVAVSTSALATSPRRDASK